MSDHGAPPEAAARFVIIVNGRVACAEVVDGLEGVRAAILRLVQEGTLDDPPGGVQALLADLGEAAAWPAHGHGDGRPFWHRWIGLPHGSIAVQRLTGTGPDAFAAMLGEGRCGAVSREVLANAIAVLADCVADLRGTLVAGSGEALVAAADHRPRQPAAGSRGLARMTRLE